jgi:hypothetical protein
MSGGSFFDTEPFDAKNILVRNVWPDLNSCRFEQSFSPDGGKTRDVNWIATDARIEDESDGMAMGPPDEPMMNTL